jgi:hypothetical protein
MTCEWPLLLLYFKHFRRLWALEDRRTLRYHNDMLLLF